ncbi:MAG TPA: DNA replication and repair protein RecF [Thermoanaerobaculia bacterium]|nr:DNA replication and repair protein RecF [Thermoanaerobaculia bacterium]
MTRRTSASSCRCGSDRPADRKPIALRRLRLRDFRCFARLDWRPPQGPLLLLGANGSGKTSLLEAAYLAATTRSFRTGQIDACTRRGAGGFAVEAEVGEAPTRELTLELRAGVRRRRLDGRDASLAEHLEVLPILAWGPDDTEIVAGGPEHRRRLLDRGLVHLRPLVVESLGRYRRALAEKRALLARGDRRGLEGWNGVLARHGAEISGARAGLAAEVDVALGELASRHAPELPPVGLRYRPSHPSALEGEAALAAALERARAEESERRQPLLGPHRDRVELVWDGEDARRVASAGERKALGLLLLAALATRLAAAGREPALVLDDIDAELDRGRLERLAGLFEAFSRRWLSSNRPQVWEGVGGLRRVLLERPGEAPREGPGGGS